MNKQLKLLLILTPICLVLAGLTLFICLIDSTFGTDKIIITIALAVWAFFIIPSVLYAINWAKIHINNPDPARSFRIGMIWGDLIFLLLIVIAPVSGTMWFVKAIRKITSSVKNKPVENSEIEAEDIFKA